MDKYVVCLHCMEYMEIGQDNHLALRNEEHLDHLEAFLFKAHGGPNHSLSIVDGALLDKIEAQAIRDCNPGGVH